MKSYEALVPSLVKLARNGPSVTSFPRSKIRVTEQRAGARGSTRSPEVHGIQEANEEEEKSSTAR